MTSDQSVFKALLAFDTYMEGRENTLQHRIEAMRAALGTIAGAPVAMCETCFTTWPINNAPAVCPVCSKGRT